MDRTIPPPKRARLSHLPGYQLQEMIRRGEISVPELVADSLTAIDERDGDLNAFSVICPERALAEAEAAQKQVQSTGALLPLLGLPLAVWVASGAFVLAVVIQYHTRLGRHILAIGGDEDVAELSGINPKRVRITAFGVAGFFFGIAGVLAAAQLGQSNAVIADGRLFADRL